MTDYDHFAAAAIIVSIILALAWKAMSGREVEDDPHARADGDWPGPRS